MAQWRAFNASNDPDTCLWCGNRLRFRTWMDTSVKINMAEVAVGNKHPTVRAETSGDYEDGFFCGLRCAYQFAVRLAQLDRRLAPKNGAP